MAIVMFVMALMLGTGLTLLSAQQDQQRIEDTNTLLSSANEALIGYALSHTSSGDLRPYLPCPDGVPGAFVSAGNTANNGVEDRVASGVNAGACDTQEGNLPWVTLGISPPTDAWSNRLRYRVTSLFSNSLAGMQLTFVGDINVRDAAAGTIVVTSIPAIILSHGKNGLGAINTTCNSVACYQLPPAANVDELPNTNNDPNFVSHSLTPAGAVSDTGAAVGYFDDQLIWLSPNILFNRMVQAGKLP